MTSNLLSPAIHGFFTARGGYSEGAYESLNAAVNSADDPRHIRHNLQKICATLNVSAKSLRYLTQIHSGDVFDAKHTQQAAHGDGLITDNPNYTVSVVTADCLPILLASENHHIVGAVHGGWRGLARNIIENAVQLMEHKGAKRATLKAVIGPCIAKEHYEIDRPMQEWLIRHCPTATPFLTPGRDQEHVHLDLAGWCLDLLKKSGVQQAKWLGIDTYLPTHHCFSHRRAQHNGTVPTGRQLSVIRACPSSSRDPERFSCQKRPV